MKPERVLAAVRCAMLLVATDPTRLPRLGYPRSSSGFQERHADSYWQLVGMARELGCEVADLRPPEGAASIIHDLQRVRRAAEDLMEAMLKLPLSIRSILIRKAAGWSWRKMQQVEPGRVMWSMLDDLKLACRLLQKHVTDADIMDLAEHSVTLRPRAKKALRRFAEGAAA